MERIYHTWDKWECYPAGFYNDRPPNGLTDEECENIYMAMLSDIYSFEEALEKVISEWINSCEHYLTNERMNRIAWLGQAALSIKHGIPSRYRGGYNKLSDEQKYLADMSALKYLNKWREKYGEHPLMLADAQSKTEVDLY